MKNFKISVDHIPGSFAELTTHLAENGINVEGSCGVTCDKIAYVNLVTSDSEATKRVLEESNFNIDEIREILVVMAKNHPGTISALANKLGSGGVNIDLFYIGTNNRMIFGVDDLPKAKKLIDELFENQLVNY